MATTTKKGFFALPAELRNQIYEDYMAIIDSPPTIRADILNKTTCKTIYSLALALGLDQTFPLILASKQIMHEALPYCLQTCNVRLSNIGELQAINEAYHLLNFRNLATNIHALTLDLSKPRKLVSYSQARSESSWSDAPLLELFPYQPTPRTAQRKCMTSMICSPRLPPPASGHFTKLLQELRAYFPNATTLNIEFDESTIVLQEALRACLASLEWPSLREAKVTRPDLERRIAMFENGLFAPKSGRSASPPERIPWVLDMDRLFLHHVNKELVKILCKEHEDKANEN